MTVTYLRAICACGSKTAKHGHQVQVVDPKAGCSVRWATKADRLTNKRLIVSPRQQCVWMADPTNITCDACGKDCDLELLTQAAAEMPGTLAQGVTETVGVVVGNAAAIARVDFK